MTWECVRDYFSFVVVKACVRVRYVYIAANGYWRIGHDLRTPAFNVNGQCAQIVGGKVGVAAR